MDENIWAARKAKEIKERHDKQELDQRTRAHEWEQVKAWTPDLWEKLQAAIEQRATALRGQLKQPDILRTRRQGDIFLVDVGPMRTVELRLEMDKPELHCSLVNTSLRYVPKLVGGVAGSVAFVGGEGRGAAYTPDQIAEAILDDCARFL